MKGAKNEKNNKKLIATTFAQVRARLPWKPASENDAFVRDFPQKLKVKVV